MSIKYLFVSFFLIATLTVYAQDNPTAKATPPFHGTIFLDPDIITPNDPSSFQSLTPAGQGSRTMFDRRVNNWVTVNAFLFNVIFDDGLSTEVQVNPEFGSMVIAQVEADKYAWVIGQLPTCLRKDVKTVWIHKGTQLFGGGNNNLLIHVGQTALYEKDGILEEALVHEATHTSLDANHALEWDWLRAQQNDRTFISTYAQENSKREDVAESFLLYIAVTLRADRISDELKETISATIPNRLNYFSLIGWDFYPLVPSEEQLQQITPEEEIAPDEQVVPEDEGVEILTEVVLPQLQWLAFDGIVPENSVSGGRENGDDLPVCRGNYQGGTHPGKLVRGKCNIGWGGNEIELKSFDVLVNTGVPLIWKPYTGSIPHGAIEAGKENGRTLYVGQFTRPDGSIHAGKVLGGPGNYTFNYGYGGKELTEKSNFRILSQ